MGNCVSCAMITVNS